MPHPDDVAPATENESVRVSDNREQAGAFETAPKFSEPAPEVLDLEDAPEVTE